MRGLYPQSARIDELYKLTAAQIKEAMSGVNTEVPEWRAENLEAADYNRLMRSPIGLITRSMTEMAYGYNAAVKAVADPLSQVYEDGPRRFVNIPNVLDTPDESTGAGLRLFYFYQDGKLLGFSSDTQLGDEVQLPTGYATADTVECFNASISAVSDGCVYDADVSSKDLAQYGFRCYACPIVGGIPSEVWEDVTDTAFYTYSKEGDAGNGFLPKVAWNHYLLSYADMYPAVKILKEHHVVAQTTTDLSTTGTIVITLTDRIPPGAMDVFLDGEILIPEVDYRVNWPSMVIYRRSSALGDSSHVVVRMYGPCNPVTMKPYTPREVGYIKQGIASINAHYDIRNDRAFRVSVAGQLKDRAVVRFSEASSQGILQTDGRPYMVSDYLVTVENFTSQKTVPYRQQSLDLDARVMSYLGARLPEVVPLHPHIVTERWEAFSPFCSAIIHALKSGVINSAVLNNPYTDVDVDSWVTPFKYLLAYDPCVQGFDYAYQVVYPHPFADIITLTQKQYAFVEAVIRLYLNNQTDLSYFVDIEG